MSSLPNILMLIGVSGAGKTTIQEELLRRHPDWKKVVSCTTRPIRAGEVEGKDYHFLTKQQFEELERGMVEKAHVHGNMYGLYSEDLDRVIEGRITGVLVVDYQGARIVRDLYGRRHTTIVSLIVSAAAQKARLVSRGTDSEETMARRLQSAHVEDVHCRMISDELFDSECSVADVADMIEEYLNERANKLPKL